MMLGPLLFCGLLESGLRLGHYGYPTSFFLLSRIDGHPAWVENQKFGWRFFPRAVARTPGTIVMDAAKPPNTCRVFVFGGSAAYGDPNAAFGFSRDLTVLLRERFPATHFEVVNAAMTAINSHVVLPIARECAAHAGDLWVIYMGNNEVVGPYGAGTIFGSQSPPLALVRVSIALKTTRIGQLLDNLVRMVVGRHGPPQEWLGMEFFRSRVAAEDPRLARAYASFRRNLEDILRAGVRARARIVLCTVACNLKDCPPFASLHRAGLAGPARAAWERAFQSGVKAEAAGQDAAASDFYRRAAQLDGDYAETSFRWGRCELALSNAAAADSLFIAARDHDALRFRADSRLNHIIRETASHWPGSQVRLVDVERMLNQASAAGVAGSNFFCDHVHFNFAGNYRLARSAAVAAARLLPALAAQTPHGPWASQERCAEALAYTDWNRLGIAEMLRERIRHPPFTAQCDHAEQAAQLDREVAALRARVTHPALLSMAAVYHRALAAAPNDWMLWENLAFLLSDAGDANGSAQASRHEVELAPQRPDGWTQLGISLARLGRTAGAEKALRRGLALRPGDPRALYGLGLARLHDRHFTQAAALFSASLRRRPDSADAEVGLGEACAGLGENAKALAHYREALGLNPADAEVRAKLLGAMGGGGELDEKIRFLEQAVQASPRDGRMHLELGQTLFLAGRHAEAAPQFAAAAELAPQIEDAHYYLGLELARQKRYDQARAQFAEAVRLQPQDVDARMNYGVSLARTQDFAAASLQFAAVLRLQPDNPLARKYLNLARARLGQPRPAQNR